MQQYLKKKIINTPCKARPNSLSFQMPPNASPLQIWTILTVSIEVKDYITKYSEHSLKKCNKCCELMSQTIIQTVGVRKSKPKEMALNSELSLYYLQSPNWKGWCLKLIVWESSKIRTLPHSPRRCECAEKNMSFLVRIQNLETCVIKLKTGTCWNMYYIIQTDNFKKLCQIRILNKFK